MAVLGSRLLHQWVHAMTDLKLFATKIALLITALTMILVGLALKQHDTLEEFASFTLTELEGFLDTYGDFPSPWEV